MTEKRLRTVAATRIVPFCGEPPVNTLPRVVTLYTRQGCHLCDVAHTVLQRHGLEPTIIDIDTNPDLRERYTSCVPVVTIDGKIRFRGRVNEALLRRLLVRARRPRT